MARPVSVRVSSHAGWERREIKDAPILLTSAASFYQCFMSQTPGGIRKDLRAGTWRRTGAWERLQGDVCWGVEPRRSWESRRRLNVPVWERCRLGRAVGCGGEADGRRPTVAGCVYTLTYGWREPGNKPNRSVPGAPHLVAGCKEVQRSS